MKHLAFLLNKKIVFTVSNENLLSKIFNFKYLFSFSGETNLKRSLKNLFLIIYEVLRSF